MYKYVSFIRCKYWIQSVSAEISVSYQRWNVGTAWAFVWFLFCAVEILSNNCYIYSTDGFDVKAELALTGHGNGGRGSIFRKDKQHGSNQTEYHTGSVSGKTAAGNFGGCWVQSEFDLLLSWQQPLTIRRLNWPVCRSCHLPWRR